jgi:tRNA(fMet)-specific endonuclease VapC
MITHLLDTNVVSYLLRKNPPRVTERLERLGRSRVAVSVVTAIELREGADLSTQPLRYHSVIDRVLSEIPVLALEPTVAAVAGRIRAHLRRAGKPIGDLDSLIAGHALAAGLVLVTHNFREFGRVPGLEWEDWV